KGFSGFEAEIGRSLPANTYYVAGPLSAPEDLKTEHGLRMAQIVTALVTNNLQNPGVIKEFYLYNVFGYSNFKAAIDDAIARQIDVISYSEVWEYGGNNDGEGFINKQVSRATKAGITWVNAAGNFALTTFNSKIKTVSEDWLQLPDQNNALMIRCEENPTGKCNMKVVLSWSDFKNDVELGTNKDLDLALTDDLLNIVQNSALQQSNDPNEARPGFSKYPREILIAEVKVGTYFLRVKNRSKNFSSQDSLRITIDGENITMPSRSKTESLLNPADNPSVITVGASDSDRSSISASLGKPDVLAPSSMVLQGGSEFRGSSNATAIVAAGVALLKSVSDKALTRSQIISKITRSQNWGPGPISLNGFGFMPTQRGCFVPREWKNPPPHIQQVLSAGGILVGTTMQVRFITPYDPISLVTGAQRRNATDMVVVTLDGQYQLFGRQDAIPQGAVEIFQRPVEAGLCVLPARGAGKNFGL
ncbi:MAG: S8 family serine peptidase, partial [Bdellovibrionaceae bacterium]|nr:S8 family serine peptidase [Pseudobdellovibrionaceae bacterium]